MCGIGVCLRRLQAGVVLCVAWGWVAGHVWSQQLVGTECLSVFHWSQVLRFQEADVVFLGSRGLTGPGIQTGIVRGRDNTQPWRESDFVAETEQAAILERLEIIRPLWCVCVFYYVCIEKHHDLLKSFPGSEMP